MCFITFPDVILRQFMSMLTGANRNARVLAYPEVAALDRSMAHLWLDAFSPPAIIVRTQARMECHKFCGPYTNALLLDQRCCWCEHISLKCIDNKLHAEDDHSAALQLLGF
jgi:hypothetical protein